VSSRSRTAKPVAELFKASAKKAGIQINTIIKDANVFRKENLVKGKYDIAAIGTSTNPGLYDPTGRWHSKSIPPRGGNYPRFSNIAADEIIDKVISECEDDIARNKLYKDLHKIMYDEQAVIFMYNPQKVMFSSEKVDNLVTSALRPGYFPEYVTLE